MLTPEEAAHKVLVIAGKIPQMTVLGIAGPGDPLANPEKTFRTFELIADKAPDIKLCLSTNGLMLPEYIDRIKQLNIDHVTITINMVDPEIGEKIYSWVHYNRKRYRGIEAARILHEKQMEGLQALKEADILCKVNSVMIPGINDHHLEEVNKVMRSKGAFIHNIMPLISAPEHGTHFGLTGQRGPTPKELKAVQDNCSGNMKIMRHCRQCRADAVGLLGEDRSQELPLSTQLWYPLNTELYDRTMDKISWGYARISTEEQTQDSDALGKQIKKLQNAGCSKVYYDIRSRTTESRDGLNQLIADLKNCDVGSIDSLKFTRIDRIGSSSRLFYSLLEVLKIKKIKLVALEQGIDVDSLGGELTIDMLLAASKFEIKMLSHRVKSDRAYRTSQGRPNNVYPFGFKIADDKYVFNTQPLVCTLADKREFTYIDVARLMFDLYFETNSIGKTCQKIHQYFGLLATGRTKKEEVLNIVTSDSPAKYKSNYISNVPMHFSKASIRIILMNPVYAGGTPYDMYRYENGKKYKKPINEWNISWGTHEGIISQSQHEDILQNFKNNRNNKWAATDDKNPYIRKLTCIYCSGGFVRQYYRKKDASNTKEYWYQCSNYRDRRCTNKKMISEKNLDLGIQRIFKAKVIELGELIDRRLELESAPTIVETPELATLRNNLNSLRSMATNEIIERAISETEEKIDYLIRSAEVATPNYTKISDVLGVIQDEEFWLALSTEDKRRFLQEFVRRVMVDAPNVINIIFSFRC